MKKFIFIIFISLFFPVSSYGAAKIEGSKCFTYSKTKKVNSVQYVCQKKNGKLVWTKNNQIKPSVPLGSCQCPLCCTVLTKEDVKTSVDAPSPIVTPTPTPTSSPLPVPIVEEKKLSRIEKIYEKVNKEVDSIQHKHVNINAIYSPTVNTLRAEEIVKKYKESISFYSKYINKDINIVFMSELDESWWNKKVKELEGINADTSWWQSKHCPISSMAVCGYGSSNKPMTFFYHLIGSQSKWVPHNQITADHEAVHVAQLQSWNTLHPNCWVAEGQANALGFILSSRTVSTAEYRQQQISFISRVSSNFRNFSNDEWIKVIRGLNENPSKCFSEGLGYSVGMIAIESLYEKYSFDKVMEFFIDFSQTRSFDMSSKKILGIGEEDLYLSMAEYMSYAVKSS